MTHRWILATALASCAMVSMAQTVYESRDKAGPVFSDRPSPGASTVQLEAPNVIDVTPVPKQSPAVGAGQHCACALQALRHRAADRAEHGAHQHRRVRHLGQPVTALAAERPGARAARWQLWCPRSFAAPTSACRIGLAGHGGEPQRRAHAATGRGGRRRQADDRDADRALLCARCRGRVAEATDRRAQCRQRLALRRISS